MLPFWLQCREGRGREETHTREAKTHTKRKRVPVVPLLLHCIKAKEKMKLTTIAAVAAAGVGLPLPISSFPATAAPPPAATAGAVGTTPTVPPSHLNATVPAVRVEQEHQLINWQPELTLKAATDVGSDSGTESPSTGTFSRHWHSMTEMTLVLTIMVLVRAFLLFHKIITHPPFRRIVKKPPLSSVSHSLQRTFGSALSHC